MLQAIVDPRVQLQWDCRGRAVSHLAKIVHLCGPSSRRRRRDDSVHYFLRSLISLSVMPFFKALSHMKVRL